MQLAGHRRLREIQQRRHQIDVLHQVGDAASAARVALLLDDERDVDRFVVHEQPMLLFAVIAEAFAVIRQQHDGRSVVELVRFQIANQPADDLVAVGDLAVVRRELRKPLGRRVRLVRLVQMQKQKGARRSDGIEPAFGDRFRRGAVALHQRRCVASADAAGMSPSKKSKPCAIPVSLRSTNAETTPPVV